MTKETPPISPFPMGQAVRQAYARGEDDEAMNPLVLVDRAGQPVGRVQDGDYVIFYDLRGEREIELTQAFTEPHFPHFTRRSVTVPFATMIQYDPDLRVRVAFPPLEEIQDTLCETVSRHGLRQVKVAESEKAIHIGYFLNGKRKEPFPGEETVIVPSPHGADYTQVPEMSAAGVAQAAIRTLQDPTVALTIVNFANVDVVGHSEDAAAIKRAVAEVDRCLGLVVQAAQAAGVVPLITADHGTVERWLYPDGVIDTGHTASPVPFVVATPALGDAALRPDGALTDIAPTVLGLLGLPLPAAMTGRSLFASPLPQSFGRVLLVILDGWGLNDDARGNLIAAASTPVMDALTAHLPHTRLQAAGEWVGLSVGAVGNSEVGHLHMGAGRLFPSDRSRIDQAIADGSYFQNEVFRWAMQGARQAGTRLHLLGIVSFYSSHGAVEHLLALMRMAKQEGAPEVYIHGMLGRRGERPESGAA
ncbi:MAG: phosphoglycerate mutase (2,3-diphosphoglycerate-independent), partial [Chloroflexi bacterium]|nr:phosphoglycerate mutase (2,3-diphosphoglycerate-independent) [Chloroflexota bacterium]